MPELLPVLLAERQVAGGIELDLSVPGDMLVFDGHFDRHPIVPGIAEVDWAVRLARPRLPVTGTFKGLSRLKFSRVIQPPASLTLSLAWKPGALAFEFRDARGSCSSGEVLFEPLAGA